MGGVASPSSAGNSVRSHLQHTLPPSLGARQRGDTRRLPLEERAVLHRELPTKGDPMLLFGGCLGASLCGFSKPENAVCFCQDR